MFEAQFEWFVADPKVKQLIVRSTGTKYQSWNPLHLNGLSNMEVPALPNPHGPLVALTPTCLEKKVVIYF